MKENQGSKKSAATNVFPLSTVVLIIFLAIGFIWDLWHPGWLIFLTVPIITYFMKKNDKEEEPKE